MYGYLPTYICAYHMCAWCLRRSEEESGSSSFSLPKTCVTMANYTITCCNF